MSYTTAYDSIFQEVGQAFGFDPLLLKTIAIKESGINPFVRDNQNGNGSTDIGLMQINNRDNAYQKYGYEKLKNDPKTNVMASAEILQDKVKMLQGMGQPVNTFNLLHAYNGWSPQGEQYANSAYSIYQSLGGSSSMTPNELSRRKAMQTVSPSVTPIGELSTVQTFIRFGVYLLIVVFILIMVLQLIPKPSDELASILISKGGK